MKSTLLLFLIAPFFVCAQVKLEKKTFLDNKIELMVPSHFKPMSEQMMNAKYPNQAQRPSVILTDDAGEVNLVISQIPQPLKPEQVGAFKDYQVAALKRIHPGAKWGESGVKAINGKQVGYFKFTVDAVDQPVFNYYFFTDLDGKILLLSFNCIEKLLPKWKDAAETMVSSLKVK